MARPERQNELRHAAAPALGNRRSYGDVCLNSGGDTIDMTRLDRILSFDEQTGVIEVEAGATLGTLAEMFAPRGWLPAVMPGTGFATVGGCIANDAHGKNHHNAGTFGQHVISITLMQDGKSRSVSAAKNARLFKATVGGLGQTGIIVSAKLQMLPCKGDVITVTERRIDGFDAFLEALDNSQSTYTVGWIDATAKGEALGRGILEEAETGYGLVPTPRKSKSVPFNAPRWALSKPIVKVFNGAYFRRVPARGRTVVRPISKFFFPLDKVHDWNKLYGKAGFLQFQCVLPVTEAPVLRMMLEKIANTGLASPLAVLKRMGDGRAGFLSFPMEGYTMAVDFSDTKAARTLIASLEAMTEKAGGRIYFAKDATLDSARVQSMYPELGQFQKAANAADPGRVNETDLTRRLNLRGTK
jgi:decaprenylphospho-beta-D-ribofuranose 2-oxidase